MKRLHVNIAVEKIDQSIQFYSTLFGAAPDVTKSDYAKWMLDDPRVNFSISNRAGQYGVDHLGIQVETDEELRAVYKRLNAAEQPVLEQGEVTCCYAKSEKAWIHDPQGVAWETFLTHGLSPVYGTDTLFDEDHASACCTPTPAKVDSANKSCC